MNGSDPSTQNFTNGHMDKASSEEGAPVTDEEESDTTINVSVFKEYVPII
jgi:hypothetical protein